MYLILGVIVAKNLLSIGTVNLIEDQGVQKIEIVLHGDCNLMNLIKETLQSGQNISASDSKDLGVYLQERLTDLKLPITIYRQSTYHGIRSNINNTTLMYWNYNNRSQYLNISPKSEIVDSLTDTLKFLWGEARNENGRCFYPYHTFQVFWHEDGKQKFKEEVISLFKNQAKSDEELSNFLLKYNHDSLEREDFNSLQTSLNFEWWKGCDGEYKFWLSDDFDENEVFEKDGILYQSMYHYYKEHPEGPFLDLTPIMNKMFEERLAIPIDTDKRFPRTSRIRLISKQEIDEFVDYLVPQLEQIFVLNDYQTE